MNTASANNSHFMNITVTNRTVLVSSVAASGVVIGFLIWLIYIKQASAGTSPTESVLPAINACLNTLSTCFLIAGFYFIRQRRIDVHKKLMLAALASSALFLVTYIAYHHMHGDTPFRGAGFVRGLYFTILISHILLTVVALPMILTAVFFALTARYEAHRRVARYAFPAWLYISVTGVLIFFFLKAYS